jgi:hypothetical protein
MFYVVGKPAQLFQELPQRGPQATAAVHFVSLADTTLQQKSYEPSTIGPKDYPWLSHTIETVAVKALLVGFDFSAPDTPYDFYLYSKPVKGKVRVTSLGRSTTFERPDSVKPCTCVP